MYNWDFNILWSYRWLLFEGTLVTIALTASIVVLGLLMGLIAGLAQISRFAFLRWVSWAYIELFRCTPLLVQLLWFYYALPI
ncbi:ABC transporter permease subunit [Phyllobacterium zundukense]|uniref:ABC transporter permease subunit n=2 Tax=Phyllobacterium TaxID=28100 RepID=A0ACD4D8Z9_9HYPH|nr:ABC transporter permease subunit [Phyllobacterium zundukense]UXN62285.1 ABC transporter permease subunit [Phyllobacterium zundukense]